MLCKIFVSLLSSFDYTLIDKPCIVSEKGSILLFFPLTNTLVALEGGPGGLRPYPLRFHVEEAGAHAKLIQHEPLGVAYHRI
jgi:hypothetical protein